MKIQLSDHFTYKMLLRFVLPSIIMMVFTSIYGVVDGLFVSNFVGKTPFAAVNLVMPFIMVFGGIGFMFGTGGSALVAKTMGEGDKHRANQYFTMMIAATLICGVIISTLGVIFMEPISVFLGAGAEMLPDCVLYGRIVLAFNTAYMLQNVFQSFLIAAEKPKLGLWVTVAAGVTNMALDALFMAVFHWGVAGAAIATGISQIVGGVLPLVYFLRPNSSLLQLTKTKLELRPILQASGNGASELVSNVTASVVGMLYNFQLLRLAGQNGVAAFGVLMYVEFIFAAVFIGYAIGCAPIVSYHFGAENHDELKNVYRRSMFLILVTSGAMVVLSEALCRPLCAAFVGYSPDLMQLTVHGFRLFALCYLFCGVNIYASAFFTALCNGALSAFMAESQPYTPAGKNLSTESPRFMAAMISVGVTQPGTMVTSCSTHHATTSSS